MGKISLSCYLVPWENRGYSKCCLSLSVETLHQSGIKFPIGNFTGVPIMNFVPDWEYKIVNQSGLQTTSSENRYYCARMIALSKKKSLKGVFWASLNPLRKTKVCKTKVVIQNSLSNATMNIMRDHTKIQKCQ